MTFYVGPSVFQAQELKIHFYYHYNKICAYSSYKCYTVLCISTVLLVWIVLCIWRVLFLLYTLVSHGWVYMTLCPGKLSTTMVNNNSLCTIRCPDGIILVCTGGLTNKNEGELLNQDRCGHVPHTLWINNWKNGCFKKPCELWQIFIDTFCLRDMCKHYIIILLVICVTFEISTCILITDYDAYYSRA